MPAARAAQVAVRRVEDDLVVRVGVDRGHEPLLDADGLVQHLHDGAMQFVVQEALEMTACFLGSYLSALTPITTVASAGSSPFAGAEMITLLAPASRCLAAPARVGKRPVELDHHVDLELRPRKLGGVDLRKRPHPERPSHSRSRPSACGHGPRKAPEDRVVAQQVGQGVRVDEVVDRDDFKVGVLLVGGAQHAATDAAKTVDGYSYSH